MALTIGSLGRGGAMRILIAGADGQLGRAVARRAVLGGHVVVPMSRTALDVGSIDAAALIAAAAPDVVINAAAMTDVDGCESDIDAAYRINALGARNVALGAALADAVLVQVSTDYVFDGESSEPYWEFDAANPIGVYGASKLAGELEVRSVMRRAFIVRTAWLYGLGGRGFVSKILDLAAARDEISVVDNEFGSPTFCDDLADSILDLIDTGAFGTYHLVNEGWCSRFEFARAILEVAGQDHVVVRPIDYFERAAKPPAFSPLRNFCGAELGIRLPPWRAGLERYFERRSEGVDIAQRPISD